MDHACQVLRCIGADLEAHGIGEAAGAEDFLHFVGEVGCVLFLYGDVAIAGDAERGGGGDFFTGEKLFRVGGDEVLDEYECEGVGSGVDRNKPAD